MDSPYKHTGFVNAPWRQMLRQTSVLMSLITC
ncbi:hypothetical protein R69746_02815 [Paraburkholderia aspalathi]|nr:hypothetical protein R69746_02815 [Paraburkholderia aspalathi]